MSQPLNELFLASCGLFDRWNLSISGADKLQIERTFATPYALIGSRNDMCLRLVHPDVSRRHAYLQAFPGGIFCVDLSSRHGIRWGETGRLWGWLRPGQRIHIGPFALELPAREQTSWLASSSWAPEDPLADHPDENAPLAPVIGTLSDNGKVLAEWRMNRVMVLVGRTQRCLVSAQDKSLSRLHCSLVRTPMGLWAVDLLSRTGTFLNGNPVRCARIREGDRLQVGRYVLRFWYQQSKPKVVIPITMRTNPLPNTEPARPALPSPALPEERRLVPSFRKARDTMLQAGQVPPPTAVAETGTAQTVLATTPQHGVGAENSLVLALVSQFDLMQQQMFGQFQESLLMATRLFASLHQEQMAVVRQELSELNGVAGELRSLQDELNKKLKKANAAPAATQGARKVEPIKKGATEPRPASAESRSATPAKKEDASRSEPLPTPPPDQDVHDWLTQRIVALQEEQQSRWSKLLSTILGN